MSIASSNHLKVAIAQIAPVWLDREKTLVKIIDYVNQAANAECSLVTFGEALLPGYPFWIELTDGARFNSSVQKEIHAHYSRQAVYIERGDLKQLCDVALKRRIAVYIGCIERAADRGGHSLYCSLVYIDAMGNIQSIHRKLMPTYEERLSWAQGDGNGLRVHTLGAFTLGGLNCWENWMPLVRSSLYAQGEDLHVAVWPGGEHNTKDITRFIAKEARSFVISASSLMRKSDFPDNTPSLEIILDNCPETLANGGSCIAGPDGEWIVPPAVGGEEQLIIATIDHAKVSEERQNFDLAGHYSRPDVTKLILNRDRQSTLEIVESNHSDTKN
jgi:nitrilase